MYKEKKNLFNLLLKIVWLYKNKKFLYIFIKTSNYISIKTIANLFDNNYTETKIPKDINQRLRFLMLQNPKISIYISDMQYVIIHIRIYLLLKQLY